MVPQFKANVTPKSKRNSFTIQTFVEVWFECIHLCILSRLKIFVYLVGFSLRLEIKLEEKF